MEIITDNVVTEYNRIVRAIPDSVERYTFLFPSRNGSFVGSHLFDSTVNKMDPIGNLVDLRNIKDIKYYRDMSQNRHHIQIDNILPYTNKIIKRVYRIDNCLETYFTKKSIELTNESRAFKTTYYQPKKYMNFLYKDDYGLELEGNYEDVIGPSDIVKDPIHQYSPYHKYFTGSHKVGEVWNSNPLTNNKSFIIGNSFSVPITPYLLCCNKYSLFYDNREKTKSYRLLHTFKNFNKIIIIIHEAHLLGKTALYYSLKNLV